MARHLVTLDDLFEYKLTVTCRGCRSMKHVNLAQLVAKVGGRATLHDVFRRFRCKCGGRARLMEIEHIDAGVPFTAHYDAKPVMVIDEHGMRPRAAMVDK